MTIEEEILFTNDALKIYIIECDKRMNYLEPFVSEFNKLKLRRKRALERIQKHG